MLLEWLCILPHRKAQVHYCDMDLPVELSQRAVLPPGKTSYCQSWGDEERTVPSLTVVAVYSDEPRYYISGLRLASQREARPRDVSASRRSSSKVSMSSTRHIDDQLGKSHKHYIRYLVRDISHGS